MPGLDVSYPLTAGRAADYFFQIPANRRHWVAAVQADGSGLAQTSTAEMLGREVLPLGRRCGRRSVAGVAQWAGPALRRDPGGAGDDPAGASPDRRWVRADLGRGVRAPDCGIGGRGSGGRGSRGCGSGGCGSGGRARIVDGRRPVGSGSSGHRNPCSRAGPVACLVAVGGR